MRVVPDVVRLLVLSVVLPAALTLPRVAWAKDARVDGLVAALNQEGDAAATQQTTLARVAVAVALPADDLRAEQARVALPWGDVFIAYRIAERSGHPLDKVFRARKTGASWHEIAIDANVEDSLLERDLLAAFPTLTPIAVPPPPKPAPSPPPAVQSPSAPSEAATPPVKAVAPQPDTPQKKPGFVDRFRDLLKSGADDDSSKDRLERESEQEKRDFISGKTRPR